MGVKTIELINIFIKIESGLDRENFDLFRDLFVKYSPDFYDLVPPSSFTVHFKKTDKKIAASEELIEELKNCGLSTAFLIGYSEGPAFCETGFTGKILSLPAGKSVAEASRHFIAEVRSDSFRLLNTESGMSVKE